MSITTKPADLPALSEERAAFEAWARDAAEFHTILNADSIVGRLPSGSYEYGGVQTAWGAWQARAALAVSASQQAVQAPAEAHGTEPLPHVIEERDAYASELARCRDAFPIPEPGTALDEPWQMAMGDPLCVADYVTAALANVQPKAAEAHAEADRLLDEYMSACVRSDVEARDRARAAVRGAFSKVQPKGTGVKPAWLAALEAREREHAASSSETDQEYAAGIRDAMTAYTLNASPAPAPVDGEVIDAKPKLQRRALGVCLKKLRLAHGLLIHDVAVLLNFTSAYLSQLEHGREPLTAEAAMAIATWADELPAHPRPIRSPAVGEPAMNSVEYQRGWDDCMAAWADHMRRMNAALAKPLPEGWANHAHHIKQNVREALAAAPKSIHPHETPQ